MSRQPESLLFVGAQNTGKTSLAIEMAKRVNRKTLFVIPDDGEKKLREFPLIRLDQLYKMNGTTMKARIIYDEDNPDFFRVLRDKFFNGALFFDDGMYFLLDRRAEHFRKLLFRNRQSNNDIYFICHGLSEVPSNFWTFFSFLVLFKTTDAFNRASGRTPDFENMKKRREEVNRLALSSPFVHKTYRLR